MKPRLIIQQQLTAFTNKYEVYTVGTADTKGGLVAFAQQKRLALKEKVWFYSDESKSDELFSFRAEKVMDVHGRYLVESKDGKQLGAFRKVFGKSLLNSTWEILDGDQVVLTVSESNHTLAVARRVIGFVPIVGDIAEVLMAFMKYHFIFKDSNGNIVGKYQKNTLFRDHYTLSMDDATYEKLDWKLYAAMAVALDALQSR